MKTAKLVIALLLAVAVIIGYGGLCSRASKKDSGSSAPVATVVIVGEVGTGYTVTSVPQMNLLEKFCYNFMPKSYAAGADPDVDKIIAIPYWGGKFDDYCIRDARESAFTSGAFSLTLEKTKNWLLLLVNTKAAKYSQFVAYVDLTNGLLQLPASSAVVDNISIGKLDRTTTDTALSSNPITTTAFSITSSQLLSLAKNDDMLKITSNFFSNYDKTTGVYYNLRPEFNWRGHYATIENAFQPITGYTLMSYQLALFTNTSTISVNNLCANGVAKVQATLTPPAAVNTLTGGMVYSPTVPISNTAAVPADIDYDGTLRVSDFFAEGTSGQYMALALGSCNLTGTIPAGLWEWREDSVLKAQFDVAIAAPITATDKIRGFVPSLKINTNTTTDPGRIESIDIKWYALNETTLLYEEITDLSILKYLTGKDKDNGGEVSIFLDTVMPGRYDNVTVADSATRIYPTLDWYYGANGDPAKRAGNIGIIYTLGGVGYYCTWSSLTP